MYMKRRYIMTNLLKKSTKSLSYITHIPISFDPQTLTNIIKKYDLSFKILSVHRATDPLITYIKPKKHVRLQFTQNQKLDYKLYSAMFEIYINQNPNYTNPEYRSDDMPFNPFITNRDQKLKQQLLKIWNNIRYQYLQKI